MKITAIVKKTSYAHARWTADSRIGGTIEGVHFLIGLDGRFRTGDLRPHEVDLMENSGMVEVLVTGAVPSAVVPDVGKGPAHPQEFLPAQSTPTTKEPHEPTVERGISGSPPKHHDHTRRRQKGKHR